MAAENESKVIEDQVLSDVTTTAEDRRKRYQSMGGIPADAGDLIQTPPNYILVLAGKQEGTLTYLANGQFPMNRVNKNGSTVTLVCLGGGSYFILFFFVFFCVLMFFLHFFCCFIL